MGSEAGAVEELLARNGGVAVIDGGLATQLEVLGAVFNDPLWSALCLIRDPHLIKQVHLQYLEAGADILVTSSYQVRDLLVMQITSRDVYVAVDDVNEYNSKPSLSIC